MMQLINAVFDNTQYLYYWLVIVGLSEIVLLHDLLTRNTHIKSIMHLVWILTVLYSGPIGLAIYYYSGRKQIPNDNIWRRGFRSVAHCYSGCGAGEISGIFIAAGLLNLGNTWIAVVTFILAYLAGFALAVLPLMQDGESFKKAIKDAFYSETASITVMEITAIGVALYLSDGAKMGVTRFWTSMIISLSFGLIAAYPVNVLLIRWGIKKGMHDPRNVKHIG